MNDSPPPIIRQRIHENSSGSIVGLNASNRRSKAAQVIQYKLQKTVNDMGPKIFLENYLNNLNYLEFSTEKKLFRMRRRENNPSSRQYLNQSKASEDYELVRLSQNS